ncbi:MAG: protein translocase subunit SecF [Polyangia bacterium]
MQFFKKTPKFDFMGQRRRFAIVSGVALVVSLVLMFALGPKFGIDFAGGTEIQVSFDQPVDTARVRSALEGMGFSGSEVVSFGAHESEYLISLQAISPVTDAEIEAARQKIAARFEGNDVTRFDLSPGGDKLSMRLDDKVEISEVEAAVGEAGLVLAERPAGDAAEQEAESDDDSAKHCESVTCTWPYQDMYVYEVNLKGMAERVMDGLRDQPWGAGAERMRSEWVGPKVGRQLRVAGISSIVYALLFIMLYIAVRFDLRFAPGAVAALIHDVIITVGVFTISRVEVTLATVAALLTIVGYSLNDTIVVFDRIRENLGRVKERSLAQVVNQSINQTLSRTLLTSITTLLAVVILLTVGWQTTIRDFAFALLIGVLVGTYSSVFVASPIVLWVDKRFGKKKA